MSRSRALILLTGAAISAAVVSAQAPSPEVAFTEIAAEVGLAFEHFNGASGEYYFAEVNGAGVGLVDYDNDGDLDVFMVQGAVLSPESDGAAEVEKEPLRDRLYRNDLEFQEDGSRRLRFVDVTKASGLDARGFGMGVATGDYDNDGWVDLYVTNFGANQMWRNNGDGTFSDVTSETGTDDGRWSISATFLDYDRDGWLDLYVANYIDWAPASHKPCRSYTGALDYCGPLAYNPEPDRLFRNRGDGSFEVVSVASGIGAVTGSGMGVVASDLDQDGWPDLYVANDGMENRMWMNNRDGTFSDRALLGGTAFNGEGRPEAGMGVAAGDFDGDGDEDLIVSHLSRETNSLYERTSDAYFEDSSLASGIALPSWEFTGFGIAWLDYDSDGWLDLAVVNGAVKRLEPLARTGDEYPFHQTNQLLRNTGSGVFSDATAALGAAADLSEMSRGLAIGDVDGDGDVDFLVSNDRGPVRLHRNDIGNRRGWLRARCLGTSGGRDMLGAFATLSTSAPTSQVRALRTSGSYGSAQDPALLFGLGSAAVTALRVSWPSGARSNWRLDLTDRSLTFYEPRSERE